MLKSNNLKTITDLRHDPLSILSYAQKTEEAVIILQHSKPKGVFLSFEKYQSLIEILEDYYDTREAEKVLNDPKTEFIPLNEFWKKYNLAE